MVKPFETSTGQENPACQPQAAKENTKGKTRGKKRETQTYRDETSSPGKEESQAQGETQGGAESHESNQTQDEH